jgi:hypothetical protein
MAVAARQTHGGLSALGERGHERLVHAAAEHHKRGVAGFSVRDAETGDELGLFAHLGEQFGELHTAAVDERDLMAVGGESGDGFGDTLQQLGIFEGYAANFDYEFHEVTFVEGLPTNGAKKENAELAEVAQVLQSS